MSDNLPPPPPPPPGFEFQPPPPPPEDDEKNTIKDKIDTSLDDIRDTIDNLINGSSPTPNQNIPPPPPGLVIPPPPPGLEIPSLSSLTEPAPSSVSESIVSDTEDNLDEINSLSDKLEVLDSLNPVQSNGESEIWELEETIVRDDKINENIHPETLESFNTPSVSVSENQNHLRLSSEVDVIPGDKLHAILSEVEESLINPDGSTIKQ